MPEIRAKILHDFELKNKVCVVVGTRPGIIKFSPIIRELQKKRVPFFMIHTGQHYSYSMDKGFFDELDLPPPRYRLRGVSLCKFHGEQTAKMLSGIESILLEEKPRLALVGGDANTNLAGALAARKLHVSVGHIEAGLRSWDWRMPEEHNRVMIDHISDYLFAPTKQAVQNLITDDVRGKIWLVGNTIVDAVKQNARIAQARSVINESLGVQSSEYLLATIHREENVDDPRRLRRVVALLSRLANFKHQIVFPLHPRTARRLEETGLALPPLVIETRPLGYMDFLALLQKSSAVITDSGGVQEECCILHVPCITIRETTERPETVRVGSNQIVGLNSTLAAHALGRALRSRRKWRNPFGQGASAKTVRIIRNRILD
jgi:UDP-N-acetylglucosamine 2-epimerase (non-hydrolysing)